MIKQRNQAYRISHWRKNKTVRRRFTRMHQQGEKPRLPVHARDTGCRGKPILLPWRNRTSGSREGEVKEGRRADRAPASFRRAAKSRRGGRESAGSMSGTILGRVVTRLEIMRGSWGQ